MKIKELDLPGFKNLRNFHVEFDDSAHTMLVGVNGSGKSNLLESLVSLFSELHLEATAPFDYRVKYECGGKEIEIAGTEGVNPTFQHRRRGGQARGVLREERAGLQPIPPAFRVRVLFRRE